MTISTRVLCNRLNWTAARFSPSLVACFSDPHREVSIAGRSPRWRSPGFGRRARRRVPRPAHRRPGESCVGARWSSPRSARSRRPHRGYGRRRGVKCQAAHRNGDHRQSRVRASRLRIPEPSVHQLIRRCQHRPVITERQKLHRPVARTDRQARTPCVQVEDADFPAESRQRREFGRRARVPYN